MNRPRRTPRPLALVALVALAVTPWACAAPGGNATSFTLSFPDSAHDGPITGRAFVMISRDSSPQPRFQVDRFFGSSPMFAVDVDSLAAAKEATVDASALGFPVHSLADLPAGDYYVQAMFNVYTQFHRSDGYTIWAHMDHWEGQHFERSAGNLYSDILKVHLDPARGFHVALSVDHKNPPIQMPADTKYVKHIKIQSERLTKFWGHPMYVGATVLLPKGYDEHPNVRYPVVYDQGHFNLRPPFGFSPDSQAVPPRMQARLADVNRETGHQFYESWMKPDFPRMIVVTFQHPTPYYDDSYAVNSANNGPYGDALLEELVPYLESHFRMIPQPWARVLTGGSTGGWESLALQVFHPRFFDGTWTLYPDPVDFRHYQLVNVYQDSNAFVNGQAVSRSSGWESPEHPMMRSTEGQPLQTYRGMSRMEAVLGTHDRSGQQIAAWEAAYGPVGKDGYPEPVWNKLNGHIDHSVPEYMKEHGFDLRAYLAAHWDSIGPDLVDKIHVDVGDMDTYFLNVAVYDLQAFLDSATSPAAHATFHYGRPEKPHGWQHTTTANILREMAAYITKHAPRGADISGWKYR
ncbi:MAG: alpha/beta hydrolase-fold protein [Candidatus Palauibacterales bacterium]|nr:alpha/beta hydrolase-fold protein [Candidatus Palauibacterales bacterium]MDP2529971.1 alpha/beta hydrolase-fold protein [Candidatus Palauibacterales bacterium]MDP2584328.1 alpha/beta hydrolase-fold protein [Candidatus Palauibacterales bacterium]